jgi:hypothetical protein
MHISKNKLIRSLLLGCIIIASISKAVSAQEIKKEALRIGEYEFFVNEIVEMVFNPEVDYRKLLSCNAVLMEYQNDEGGITAACVRSDNILWINTRLTTKNRIGSVYVCPGNQLKNSVDRLIELSFERKPLSNGMIYNLGYTNGWRRDYVHRLAILTIQGEVLACWDIGRR